MTILRDDMLDEKATFESHDLLGRESFASGLTALVTRLNGPAVFALDGKWGSGKSYFLTLWANSLRRQGITVLYFNAFQEDHTRDPFLALSSKVIALAASQTPRKERLLAQSIKIAKVLGRTTANIGLKAATAGLLSYTDVQGGAEAAVHQTGEEAEKLLRDIFEAYQGQAQVIRAFQETLKQLQKDTRVSGDNASPVVFIIDELDRCRPDFAIGVIEIAKHIFEVEGYHFVLGVNIDALGSSVNAIYGNNIDGSQYLRRFLDYTLNFPKEESLREFEKIRDYIRRMVNSTEGFSDHSDIRDDVSQILATLAVHKEYSLRDIRRIVTVLSVSLIFIRSSNLRFSPVLVVLAAMKVCSPLHFKRAREGRLDAKDISSYLEPAAGLHEENIKKLKDWWEALLADDKSPDQQTLVHSMMFQYNFRHSRDIIPYLATKVLDRFTVS